MQNHASQPHTIGHEFSSVNHFLAQLNNSRAPLAFFFVCIYTVLALLRLHEFIPGMADVPIFPPLLAFAFLLWLVMENKAPAVEYVLVIALWFGLVVSFFLAKRWPSGTIQVAIDFGSIVAFYILLTGIVRTPRRMSLYMTILVTCLAIIAVHGVLQSETGVGWTGAELSQGTRITYIGFFGDPNDLGLGFVTAISIVAIRFISSGNIILRLISLALISLFLYGIYLTNSRGAILALGAVAAGAVLMYPKNITRKLFVIGVLGLVVMVASPSRVDEISVQEGSASSRIDSWYFAIQLFRENPFFGVGQNQFKEHHVLTTHNTFLQGLTELGSITHFFWFAIFFYAMYRTFLLIRFFSSSRDKLIAEATATDSREKVGDFRKTVLRLEAQSKALWLAMWGLLGGGMFLSRAYDPILFIFLALTLANYQTAKRLLPVPSTRPLNFMLPRLFGAYLAALVFAWVGVRVLLVLRGAG